MPQSKDDKNTPKDDAPTTPAPSAFDELLAQVKASRPKARVSITEQGNIQVDH